VTLDELLSSVTGQEENSLEQIKKMFVEQAKRKSQQLSLYFANTTINWQQTTYSAE
jgi:hypothetical protein